MYSSRQLSPARMTTWLLVVLMLWYGADAILPTPVPLESNVLNLDLGYPIDCQYAADYNVGVMICDDRVGFCLGGLHADGDDGTAGTPEQATHAMGFHRTTPSLLYRNTWRFQPAAVRMGRQYYFLHAAVEVTTQIILSLGVESGTNSNQMKSEVWTAGVDTQAPYDGYPSTFAEYYSGDICRFNAVHEANPSTNDGYDWCQTYCAAREWCAWISWTPGTSGCKLYKYNRELPIKSAGGSNSDAKCVQVTSYAGALPKYLFTPVARDGSYMMCGYQSWDNAGSRDEARCLATEQSEKGNGLVYHYNYAKGGTGSGNNKEQLLWKCYGQNTAANVASIELTDYVELSRSFSNCVAKDATSIVVDASATAGAEAFGRDQWAVSTSKTYCTEESSEESWSFENSETSGWSKTQSISVKVEQESSTGIGKITTGVEASQSAEVSGSKTKTVVNGKSASQSISNCVQYDCITGPGYVKTCTGSYDLCTVTVEWQAVRRVTLTSGVALEPTIEKGSKVYQGAGSEIRFKASEIPLDTYVGGAGAVEAAPLNAQDPSSNSESDWTAVEVAGVILVVGILCTICVYMGLRHHGHIFSVSSGTPHQGYGQQYDYGAGPGAYPTRRGEEPDSLRIRHLESTMRAMQKRITDLEGDYNDEDPALVPDNFETKQNV